MRIIFPTKITKEDRKRFTTTYSRSVINPAFYNGMKYDPYKPMVVVRVPANIVNKLYGR